MTRSRLIILSAAALLPLAACQTATAPVEVTRFHLDQPLERGTVVLEPAPGGDRQSLEYQTYAAAVARELQRVGYVETPTLGQSLYVATVDVTRGTRARLAERSPVTIGIGGGTGGYGSGVGIGASFGIGGGRSRDLTVTQLAVQLKRRSDQQVVWEGRAQTEARSGAPAAQPGLAAERLAQALFRDFPGESGRTISVP